MNEAIKHPCRAYPIVLVQQVWNQTQSLPRFAQGEDVSLQFGEFPLSHTVGDLKYVPKKKQDRKTEGNVFLKTLFKWEIQATFFIAVLFANHAHVASATQGQEHPGLAVGYQTSALTGRSTNGSYCEQDTCLGTKDASPDHSQRHHLEVNPKGSRIL